MLRPEILAEAAGVKIVTSSPEEDSIALAPGNIILKIRKINESDHSLGFHLTKSRWDPLPWVTYVENDSLADSAGFRVGDCLLSVDGINLVGMKIADIATLIQKKDYNYINIVVWRCPPQEETEDNVGLALKGPLPDVAKNLVCALSETIRILECPICLETAAPPVSQCVHGHILCVNCRPKMTRCPICRVHLAQGRCLLADNLHRMFHDMYFDVNSSRPTDRNVASNRRSLRDQLFGKSRKQEETLAVTRNTRSISKAKQCLLNRLLGSREKSASVDNLTRRSEIREEAAAVPHRAVIADNLLRLSINDRAKSASTGELPRNNLKDQCTNSTMSSQIAELSRESYINHNDSQQSWSSLQMSIFSGSTDSMSYILLACPFLRFCNEVVNSHLLLEHIKSHQVPQVHFYSRNATIPFPIPFGHNVFYILHHNGCMFFFQCIEEMAWMTTTMAHTEIEWTLHGWDDNGSEIYIRRHVAYLEDPFALSSCHIVSLPKSLSIKTLNICIMDHTHNILQV